MVEVYEISSVTLKIRNVESGDSTADSFTKYEIGDVFQKRV
jgi:hypothetical protein